MARSGQAPAAEKPHDGEFDPVYEWFDDGGSYLLRLSLPGFKKEEFRVHVDSAGRLTVVGQGPPRLHKAFQLPNTANLDGITGRFDGTVLTLTVPKLQQPGAVAPPPTRIKKEQAAAGETAGDPQEHETAAPKVGRADEAETERRMEAERTTMSVRGKDVDEDKRKAAEVGPPVPGEKASGARQDQDGKSSTDHRAYVTREAARRIEAARAKVAEAKAAAERTGGQWKERAAAEGLKWAETIGQKKEVIATAVAAFTLGVFVSRALTRR